MTESLPEAVSPETLTLALRRSGVLGGARVSAVEETKRAIDRTLAHRSLAARL